MGTALLDSQGRFIFVATSYVGADASMFLGRHAWEWTLGEDVPVLKLAIGKAVMGETSRARTRAIHEFELWVWDSIFTPVHIDRVAILATYRPVPQVISRLTDRERQVAWLTSQGSHTKEILRLLDISHSTLDTYRSRLRTKTSLTSSELVAWCVKHAELLAGPGDGPCESYRAHWPEVSGIPLVFRTASQDSRDGCIGDVTATSA